MGKKYTSSAKKAFDVTDYDKSAYDYRSYWQGREYEDFADAYALEQMLKKEKMRLKKTSIYIDIGGSYGRQFPIYQKFADKIILFDYSLQSLKRAKEELERKDVNNVLYVGGNIYYMPFKDNSITAGQMIRVIHHLKGAEEALTEINRIINAFFILEFANKVHAKFIAKNIFHPGNITNLKPKQQKFRNSSQGGEGENQIFLNFHPKAIRNIIAKTMFHIREVRSVSNFRMPLMKKLFSLSKLQAYESFVQKPLALLYVGPSIYMLLEKQEKETIVGKDIFCCPICKHDLDIKERECICDACGKHYPIIDGVYDFRYDGN